MNLSISRRPGFGSEQGGALLLLAVLMLALLGVAGLAVDVRNGYVVRSMLQHAVDDGALSALRWSTQALDGPGTQDVLGQAVQESLRITQQELQSQGLTGISVVTAALNGGQLTLTASARVPTYFAALFGITQWTPQARAGTALWTPQSVPSPALGGSGGASGGGTVPSSAGAASSGPTTGAGFSGGNTGGEAGPPSPGPGPASPEPPSPTDPAGATGGNAGPCNCDAVAAADPQSAAAALERMGATPADPGPFEGDITSEIGFGEMQNSTGGTANGGASTGGGAATDGGASTDGSASTDGGGSAGGSGDASSGGNGGF